MIIINKSFVLERSRIFFFFSCIINAIVHFRSSQPIFNMWFSDFPKKDKICFLEIQTNDNYLKYWFFIKTVVVMQIVYHLLRKTGHGISFKLRHPYSDIEIIATTMSFFNAIFFYFYPTFQGRFVGLLRSRLNVRILASIYSLLFTDT